MAWSVTADLVLLYCLQETDDNELQLEDATDPTQTVSQLADPLPAERDVPVNCITSVGVIRPLSIFAGSAVVQFLAPYCQKKFLGVVAVCVS